MFVGGGGGSSFCNFTQSRLDIDFECDELNFEASRVVIN